MAVIGLVESNNEDINKLIAFCESRDRNTIDLLANTLFMDRKTGAPKWENIREFERAAKAKVTPPENDGIVWGIGYIHYQGETYTYG